MYGGERPVIMTRTAQIFAYSYTYIHRRIQTYAYKYTHIWGGGATSHYDAHGPVTPRVHPEFVGRDALKWKVLEIYVRVPLEVHLHRQGKQISPLAQLPC